MFQIWKKFPKLFLNNFSNFFFSKNFFYGNFFYKFFFGKNFYYRTFFGEKFSFHKNISAKIFSQYLREFFLYLMFAKFFIGNFAYCEFFCFVILVYGKKNCKFFLRFFFWAMNVNTKFENVSFLKKSKIFSDRTFEFLY